MQETNIPNAGRVAKHTPIIRQNIPHVISPSCDGDELFCERRVEFAELTDCQGPESNDDGIRIYGGHACATLQLRGVSALTRGGKPRCLIATATYLDKREVHALIIKLTEIEATLS